MCNTCTGAVLNLSNEDDDCFQMIRECMEVEGPLILDLQLVLDELGDPNTVSHRGGSLNQAEAREKADEERFRPFHGCSRGTEGSCREFSSRTSKPIECQLLA